MGRQVETSGGPRAQAWLWAGPLGALIVFLVFVRADLPRAQAATAAIAFWCALWWIAQPVHLAVTSLLPFALFPFFGVLDHNMVSHAFGHTMILLLMAGFMLSMAIEASGAHRRLALGMARLVGGKSAVRPGRLLFGFMLASAGASMWISNTATTLILLPIALASTEAPESRKVRAPLLVGIAYAASIGGIGTPIGTPPNLLFLAAQEKLGAEPWSFLGWMKVAVPVVALLLPAAYFVLVRGLPSEPLPPLPEVARASVRERRVILVFALTALGWITRLEPFGGWSGAFGAEGAGDATVALMGLLMMLLVSDGKGGRLLSFEEAAKIPWGILLLFGGGIALADGFESSGLSETLGSGLGALTAAPEWLMIFAVCLSVTFLTEVTSNTATTALLMPILGAAAQAAGIAPEKLMFPAALSASCAFMLPVATAPNAIICGTGEVTTPYMAKRGLVLNLLGVVLITGLCLLAL